MIRILVDTLTRPTRLLERLGISGAPTNQVRTTLRRANRLAVGLNGLPAERAKVVHDLVEKVIIEENAVTVRLQRAPLFGVAVASGSSETPNDRSIDFTAAMGLKRHGVELKLVLPGVGPQDRSARCDPTLIKAIARGRAWFEELANGRARSLRELAERDGITRRYVRRLVHLAFLSPDLVEAILQGRQRVELTATHLTQLDLPRDWTQQHSLLAS